MQDTGNSARLTQRFASWRQAWGARVLSWLDGFLSDSLREARPEDLSRYRLLVGIILALLLFNVSSLFSLRLAFQPWLMLSVALVSGASNVTSLVLLRRQRTHEPAALLTCSTLAVVFVYASLASDNPFTASHASAMLLPALSVYLVGARHGFLLTLGMSLAVGVVHPVNLLLTRGLTVRPGPAVHVWGLDVMAAFCMGGVWAVSWLHLRAREQLHASREKALRIIQEREHELARILENTDDLVCSLDIEGRVVIANSALRRVFQLRYGEEPRAGESLVSHEAPEIQEGWKQALSRTLRGQRVRVEEPIVLEGRVRVFDHSFKPILGLEGQPVGMTLFTRDITERKEAETKLREMHRMLMDVSRQAGMAEVATGLLHNVGNTLNSVNVSVSLVTERLQGLRGVSGLARAVQVLREHSGELGDFLTRDPQGRQLLDYLSAVSESLSAEQRALLDEQRALAEHLEHVKSIIAMQQEHARASNVEEVVTLPQFIDDALRLHASSFQGLGIEVRREYGAVPPVLVDRHKLLQILVHLLSNARNALLDGGRSDKWLGIRVEPTDGERLRIQVSDNGVGIAHDQAPRLFTQGFTTREGGRGFWLHLSAIAAEEMGGHLSCQSEGPGRGATFTIELPMRREPLPVKPRSVRAGT